MSDTEGIINCSGKINNNCNSDNNRLAFTPESRDVWSPITFLAEIEAGVMKQIL